MQKRKKRHERKKAQNKKRRDDDFPFFSHKSRHEAEARIMRPPYIMAV